MPNDRPEPEDHRHQGYYQSRRTPGETELAWRPDESWDEYSARWSEWARGQLARRQQSTWITNNIIYSQPITQVLASTRDYWATNPYGSTMPTTEKRIHLASPIFCREVLS